MSLAGIPSRARALLYTDALAGAVVGVFVIALHPWLAGLYGLVEELVLAIGITNLTYGGYSSALAFGMFRGRPPTRRNVDLLILGNALWSLLCLLLAFAMRSHATFIGVATLTFEGAFVLTLALLERRYLRPHLT